MIYVKETKGKEELCGNPMQTQVKENLALNSLVNSHAPINYPDNDPIVGPTATFSSILSTDTYSKNTTCSHAQSITNQEPIIPPIIPNSTQSPSRITSTQTAIPITHIFHTLQKHLAESLSLASNITMTTITTSTSITDDSVLVAHSVPISSSEYNQWI